MPQVTLEVLAERIEKLEQGKESACNGGSTLEALAQRIEKLERAMSRLQPEPSAFKDWRLAVEHMANMPPGDEEFRRAALEAGRQWREAERQAACEAADRE